MRVRLRARRRRGSSTTWPWVVHFLGRLLQLAGLLVTLLAATQYFGTDSTTAMLRTMLAGVLLFVPGWLLARRDPTRRGER
jgi:hypothetical protein